MYGKLSLTLVVAAAATLVAGRLATESNAGAALLTECGENSGPDVIVGALPDVANYASFGGMEAFSIATTSCNIGTEQLEWVSNTNQHPLIAQNMFRLKDGRFEQIGQSWLKHGFFALQQEECCVCENSGTGSRLGVGCSDPYSANRNGGPNGLGPKYEVNANTGFFPYPYSDGDGSTSSVYKRIQVPISDLDPAQDGGGQYFVEGHYVTPDDAASGNQNNNASYREIAVSGAGDSWSASLSGMPSTQREMAGIRAWLDHDPGVVETDVQIPGEGLLIVAAKATDLGGGWHHYEYAVQNLNSDRAVGSFSVPLADGTAVQNIGFHDVHYHSGEPYDGTDWAGVAGGGAVTWSTDDHSVNPNANALRWGTLYNFRFDAAAAPVGADVTLGLFKPGTPSAVSASSIGPAMGPPSTGGCCVSAACTVETAADCSSLGGSWLGADTDCAGDPCLAGCPAGEIEDCFGNCAPAGWVGDGICDDGGRTYNGVPIFLDCAAYGNDGGDCDVAVDIVNLATSDFATPDGSIAAGTFLNTHAQDDGHEALQERHTGGKPARRRSLLGHVWSFNVAAGTAYRFEIDAYHTTNFEGDDFVFSFSRDDVDYTSMLTVTKTADDDSYQTYVFAEDVSGTVYVKVEDTDNTQGNGSRDTVYVDHMLIVTVAGGPDVTPPSPPQGLGAVAESGSVSLDWSDNQEPDLDGYLVHRSESSGGPYAAITPAPIPASDYVDTAVTNGTTYYYVVSAVDAVGNESGPSDEAVATPQTPGGNPTSLHVAAIDLSTQNGGGGKRGVAVVTVVDDQGGLVAGAVVMGTFTGDYDETLVGVTDIDGVTTILTTGTSRGNVQFTFCVDSITHVDLVYNAAANVETCDTR